MQNVTAEQLRIFASGGEGRLVARSLYEGNPLRPDLIDGLPIVGGSISCDTDKALQMSGELVIADPSGLLVPTGYDSPLSPYGVQVRVEWVANAGSSSTKVQLGLFRLDKVPQLEEYLDLYRNGQWAHRGASIKIDLLGEAMAAVDDDIFEAPVQPLTSELVSTWAMIIKLAGRPVTINPAVPDKPIPTALIFPDNRLNALYTLAQNLGAILCELPDGTLSARPATVDPSQPDWEVLYGDQGKVITPPRSFARDKFYNVWISRSESTDQDQVQARVAISEGPLREGGPMGRRQDVKSDKLITTYAEALADATARRAAMLAGQPSEVELSCVPNPALQGGDVVAFPYFNRTLSGELTKWTLNHNDLQKLTVKVQGGSSPWE